MRRRHKNPRGTADTLIILGAAGAIGYGVYWFLKNKSAGVSTFSIPGGGPDWGVFNGVAGNYPPVGTPGQPSSYRN